MILIHIMQIHSSRYSLKVQIDIKVSNQTDICAVMISVCVQVEREREKEKEKKVEERVWGDIPLHMHPMRGE